MDKPISGEFILSESHKGSATAAPSVLTTPTHVRHSHHEYPDIRSRKLGFSSSLSIDPENITIAGQDPDEVVHLLVRRHLITDLRWIVFVVILSLLPLFLPFFSTQLNFLHVSGSTITSFLLLYFLALFGYILLKFCEWYFHVGLITNKRLIDIDMNNILSRNIAETEVIDVQDVAYTQKGILQSAFNYGNVQIQTEAVEANFEYDKVPRPSQVAEIIADLAMGINGEGDRN